MAGFVELLLAGDRAAVLAVARRAFDEGGPAHLYEDVLEPALRQVGERWERNEIGVGDEHVATALAQAAIASLYPLYPWPAPGAKAVVACVPGERHDLGARMVADLLCLDGWDAAFLGADAPMEAVVGRAADARAVLVGLSVTLPSHLPAAREVVIALRACAGSPRLLVGGAAVARLPDPVSTLGVDAFAQSARRAVLAARSFRP